MRSLHGARISCASRSASSTCTPGLAKATSDWLLHAEPLNIWLSARTGMPRHRRDLRRALGGLRLQLGGLPLRQLHRRVPPLAPHPPLRLRRRPRLPRDDVPAFPDRPLPLHHVRLRAGVHVPGLALPRPDSPLVSTCPCPCPCPCPISSRPDRAIHARASCTDRARPPPSASSSSSPPSATASTAATSSGTSRACASRGR